MNGIVVIDKPKGTSSAQVVGQVKRLLRVKKAGHTGTLDPFATGILVCCVNQATRLSEFLMRGEKCYEAVMRLGIETDTQDSTGNIVSEMPDCKVTKTQIERVFQRFLHIKKQVPPSFSALKHGGVPLYKLARKGVFIQKSSRPIVIHQLTLGEITFPFVRFQVRCSHGTYIRTLCSDMGKALGCGAHLVELRRTESGGFGLDDALSLEALGALVKKDAAAQCVIPMNRALKGVPEVKVDDGMARWIRHGRPVNDKTLGSLEGEKAPWVKVTDGKDLIAILDVRRKKGVFPYRCVFSHTEGSMAS